MPQLNKESCKKADNHDRHLWWNGEQHVVCSGAGIVVPVGPVSTAEAGPWPKKDSGNGLDAYLASNGVWIAFNGGHVAFGVSARHAVDRALHNPIYLSSKEWDALDEFKKAEFKGEVSQWYKNKHVEE